MTQKIELVFLEGCPHTDQARDNLRAALDRSDLKTAWKEWDLLDPAAPDYVRQCGSPTILIDGHDVTGSAAAITAPACRVDGAPSISCIRAALGA
jgi:hypothetical protein